MEVEGREKIIEKPAAIVFTSVSTHKVYVGNQNGLSPPIYLLPFPSISTSVGQGSLPNRVTHIFIPARYEFFMVYCSVSVTKTIEKEYLKASQMNSLGCKHFSWLPYFPLV